MLIWHGWIRLGKRWFHRGVQAESGEMVLAQMYNEPRHHDGLPTTKLALPAGEEPIRQLPPTGGDPRRKRLPPPSAT